jgi:hypothetical protein
MALMLLLLSCCPRSSPSSSRGDNVNAAFPGDPEKAVFACLQNGPSLQWSRPNEDRIPSFHVVVVFDPTGDKPRTFVTKAGAVIECSIDQILKTLGAAAIRDPRDARLVSNEVLLVVPSSTPWAKLRMMDLSRQGLWKVYFAVNGIHPNWQMRNVYVTPMMAVTLCPGITIAPFPRILIDRGRTLYCVGDRASETLTDHLKALRESVWQKSNPVVEWPIVAPDVPAEHVMRWYEMWAEFRREISGEEPETLEYCPLTIEDLRRGGDGVGDATGRR